MEVPQELSWIDINFLGLMTLSVTLPPMSGGGLRSIGMPIEEL